MFINVYSWNKDSSIFESFEEILTWKYIFRETVVAPPPENHVTGTPKPQWWEGDSLMAIHSISNERSSKLSVIIKNYLTIYNISDMADSGDATASRCQVNADKSASVSDANQLLDFYKEWSDKYDEV